MVARLDVPLIGDGIKTTRYFQGRVLSAEDLATDQVADQAHRAHLGRAIGPGIVIGLEARLNPTSAEPTIAVEPGLTITAEGQTVALPARALVALTPGVESDDAPRPSGLFGPCNEQVTGVDRRGDGAYVLLMSPTSGYRERAPKAGLGTNGVAPGCGARYAVEGVRFRLAALRLEGRSEIANELTAIAALDDASSTATPEQVRRTISRFRNVLAHLCLSDAAAAGQAASVRTGRPRAFDAPSTLLAELTAGENAPIAACDVPLAVLYIDLLGVRFVDRWTARRLARPRIPAGALSLLPAYGLERLLQFLEHLDDLVAEAPQAQLLRAEDYFRYLPPAGWFPAAGGGIGGLSLGQFLQPFTAGAVGRIPAGSFAEVLERSFRHRAVDLTARPYLQLYELDENETALTDGVATQRMRLFVDCASNAPLVRDGLAIVLERAWEVYRAFARRILRYGEPADDNTRRDAEAAASMVAEIASRYAAVALAGRLDVPSALDVLTRLHGAQRALTDRLAALRFAGQGFAAISIGGLSAFLDAFTTGLRRRLDTSIPETGGPGLIGTITAQDLRAAVAAQEAVNDYVGMAIGEGGAVGPTEVRWTESPNGQVVVPSGSTTRHLYEIRNGTNRRLTFLLEAVAVAPTGNWTGATALRDLTGANITRLAVDSGARASFAVVISAPADAAIGEAVTLDVSAVVPPPDDRRATSETVTLTVGNAGGAPVQRAITIPGVLPTQTSRSVPAGGNLTYQFFVLYSAAAEPTTTEFDMTLRFTGPVAGWAVAIDNTTPIAPAGQSFTRRLSLSDGSARGVQVIVVTPGNLGVSNSFTVSLTSVALPAPQISVTHLDTFTITTT